MPITFLCPNLTCRSVLQVPDQVRGESVRCAHCGTVFTVPGRQEPDAEGAQQKPDAAGTRRK